MDYNKKISITLKLIIIIFAIIGLSTELRTFNNPSLIFYFYTNLTNITILISYIGFLYIILKNYDLSKKSELILYNWKFIITISILIVMIIFNFLLVPFGNFAGSQLDIQNLCLHILVPLVTIIDWILFDKKEFLNKISIILTLIPFILYCIVIYLIAAFSNTYLMNGSKFPYIFMDYTILGVNNVLIVMLVMLIFILIISYILIKIGKYIERRNLL